MRKVTEQAVAAFLKGEKYKSGNTQVIPDYYGYRVALLLHGNLIAAIYGDELGELYISDCGYPTRTTRERLNGLPGVSVCQRAGLQYLNGKVWDGRSIQVGEGF